MPLTPEHLQAIESYESLAHVLEAELHWPEREWERIPIKGIYGLTTQELGSLQSLDAINLKGQTWGIFLADFGDEKLERRTLRKLLSALAEKARENRPEPTWPIDSILFICRSEGKNWTFVRFTGSRAQAQIRSFGWSDPLEARTALESLTKLRWGMEWDEAWAVEKLTKAFFTKLSDLFYDTSAALKEKISDENQRRLFVQTLFNRLIFLRFVEKKGWLELGGRKDYLRALWESGKDSTTPFWPTRLNALFQCVNTERQEDVEANLRKLVGTVHYLNGGLFEDDKRFVDPKINIPDKVFEELLGPDGLFYRYNFTVEESSPLDVQVAVDPEILGKIFEQLTISSKRHDTGSYYTPREIVQFMCREALVGYLSQNSLSAMSVRGEGIGPAKSPVETLPVPRGGETGGGLSEAKARALVYDHNADDLTNKEGNFAFEALKSIKVVDSACGSGAYLLGMLQELYALFDLLKRDDRKFSENPAREEHDRKLWIIENNIYGVDLQEFATNTAMLRLWLTLLVEDKGSSPQPLPNLEYKIEHGDALLGPDPSMPVEESVAKLKKGKYSAAQSQQVGLDVWNREATLQELRELRSSYQDAHGIAKSQIKSRLEAKLAELREKVTGHSKKDPAKFDWRVEFFDVFLEDPSQRLPGFDAVLANPPYVRHELITAIKPALRSVYGEFYCGTADLYTFFYARAHQLLRQGGMLAFISSNKWFRAAYGANLRKLMADQTHVRSITDFGELPVFLTAATFPMIFVTQKHIPTGVEPAPTVGGIIPTVGGTAPTVGETAPTGRGAVFTQVKTLDAPYPDVAALIAESGFALPPSALNGAEWRLVDADTAARMRRMEASGVPLGQYVKGNIYYGIKTGLSAAFVIDGAKYAQLVAEDARSAEIIKPLAVGDDVRRWTLTRKTTPSNSRQDMPRRGLRTLADKYLILTKIGTAIREYPAVFRHLSQHQAKLEVRTDRGEHWWELRACAYYDAFDGSKIMYPDIAKESRFAIDTSGVLCLNSIYIIPSGDLYLLGLLNSKAAWEWFKHRCWSTSFEESGRLQFFTDAVGTVPIPRASDADRAAIETLVQKILDAKAADPNADVSEREAEIDRRVEFLYFHQDEAPTYDAWQEHIKTEEHALELETRALIKKHEGKQVEMKETLEYADRPPANVTGDAIAQWKANKQKESVLGVLKTIAAFRNSRGGTLLIGVHDNGTIVGIEPDYTLCGQRQDWDGFVQKLIGLIKARISPLYHDIEPRQVRLDGKAVCRIDVEPSKTPHYLDGILYIRVANQTEAIEGKRLEDWLKDRHS